MTFWGKGCYNFVIFAGVVPNIHESPAVNFKLQDIRRSGDIGVEISREQI
jgi:hypothetical protein